MKSLLVVFAENVKFYRRKLGISQEELADRAQIHRTNISAIERGERNVTIKNIEKLAHALGIEPKQLLSAEERKGKG